MFWFSRKRKKEEEKAKSPKPTSFVTTSSTRSSNADGLNDAVSDLVETVGEMLTRSHVTESCHETSWHSTDPSPGCDSNITSDFGDVGGGCSGLE